MPSARQRPGARALTRGINRASSRFLLTRAPNPGAPLTYFNDGGGPSDFFGSEILAKGDFFWVYERRRDFFRVAKKKRDFFGLRKRN